MFYTYQEHGAIHYWEYWQFYSIQDANLLFNFFEVFKDEYERGEWGLSVEECLSKSDYSSEWVMNYNPKTNGDSVKCSWLDKFK